MTLNKIKLRSSVIAAIDEYDTIGQNAFFEKYGFYEARSYFLIFNGKQYPSKAILGAAFGYEYPNEGALKPEDFSGGHATVEKKLQALGFEVQVIGQGESIVLERNRIYKRTDIHQVFGGQQMGGISTPKDSDKILLFTGDAGKQHGYYDQWSSDGIFFYTGEGQDGDMLFIKGNTAIRDHIANGKELLLFMYVKTAYVRFVDKMNCVGYHYDVVPDSKGKARNAIIFELVPATESSTSTTEEIEGVSASDSLESLRDKALKSSTSSQSPSERKTKYYVRSRAIKLYVLKRANGLCEGCDSPAPFTTGAGLPYLESHHIHRLSDDGPDHPNAVIAVCPNCHRRAHYSSDRKAFNAKLASIAGNKEQALINS